MATKPAPQTPDATDILTTWFTPIQVVTNVVLVFAAIYAVRRQLASIEVVAATAGTIGIIIMSSTALLLGRLLRQADRESKQVAEELRLSHERFVRAVEGSSDGLWDWNVVSNQVHFSPRYKSMLGYTDAEVNNDFDAWERLIHPDDLPIAKKKVADYHAGRIPVYELEHRLLQKDGTYRWVLARGAILRGANGRILRMSGSHTDIDERKHLEKALRSARDAALASDQEKFKFLADISQEMRTPLNAIQDMCELMTGQTLPEPHASQAKLAHNAVGILTATIDDLLDLSEIETGHLTLDPKPTDVRELIGSACALVGAQAHEKDIKLKLDVAETVPMFLRVDPLRLRQIIANLLNNALKFTATGSVSLIVSTEPIDGKSVFLDVAVRDTGIATEVLGRLFQPFTQADASTTRQYGGTSLGLAICRRLVEAMGGMIGVESAPGAGSIFRFRVPLPVEDKAPRVEPIPAPTADLSRLHMLIVDDNAANRTITLDMLAHLGVKAEFAENGAQALEKMAIGAYDLVFMDCSMPVMDGYAATLQWRRREAPGARLPIVAITAYAMQGDREKCLAAGMDDHLPKPMRLQDIAGMLSRYASPVDPAALAKAVALVGEDAPCWKKEYLKDARRLLLEMSSAKGESLTRAAHTLKGSSLSLGARRLSVLCARIEAAGAASPELLDEAARELELVAAALA